MSMHIVKSRMKKEIDEMNSPDGTENFQLTMMHDSILHWEATLFGPAGTPYENGIFNLHILVPKNYPFEPPKVRFINRIYHCNVSSGGNICIDILKDEWSPALTLCKVIMSISSLLCECNPDDPMEIEIANLYKNDVEKHDCQAREWTRLYANG